MKISKRTALEVEDVLLKFPQTRDSDDKLYSFMLTRYIRDHAFPEISATALLRRMWRGELPKYESITRARRKLQEENPNLRGERWDERHRKAEKVRLDVLNGELF